MQIQSAALREAQLVGPGTPPSKHCSLAGLYHWWTENGLCFLCEMHLISAALFRPLDGPCRFRVLPFARLSSCAWHAAIRTSCSCWTPSAPDPGGSTCGLSKCAVMTRMHTVTGCSTQALGSGIRQLVIQALCTCLSACVMGCVMMPVSVFHAASTAPSLGLPTPLCPSNSTLHCCQPVPLSWLWPT